MNLHAIFHFLHLHWILAMVAVFVMIVATTYWPGRKARVERAAMIPLEDDR